ncbi:ABC transporter permease (plasmid) [Gemmobacter fulvus]|uniref:ABC transporter permease n=1 Tax=Gemmobacter fulvus TaxID=2840474 RepID=A0A975PAC2_9RHOB|nr:ABC transporter permease [Gemmobacter fulvus]MBT9246211.1 ABC transporter permease [Gemmobacter fulvus]QWK92430.1 ABC transporter permease [Gemmobacter fulvus]
MAPSLRSDSVRKAGAALLILPLAAFLLAVFFVPIGGMLGLSVRDTELASVMPLTTDRIGTWDGRGLPDAPVFEALARDLHAARQTRTAGVPARRLSYDRPEFRAVISNTARALSGAFPEDRDWTTDLPALDPAWGQPAIWTAIHRARGPASDFFLLVALDLRRDAAGEIARAPAESRLYVDVLLRTLSIAFTVTVIALLLALPCAYLLQTAGLTLSSLLMIVLLLPLWTSLLVRSAAWMVILQKNGLVNSALLKTGLIAEPLELVFNRTGVLIALTHILLPYAVLPVLAAMRNVPRNQTLAASSLGAGALRSFFSVYLPQIVPGISAGGLLVFILALGYYITPLLLGGAGDQLLPYYIAFNTTQTVNWGLAASLGAILLAATFLLYGVYVRLVGVDRIGLG